MLSIKFVAVYINVKDEFIHKLILTWLKQKLDLPKFKLPEMTIQDSLNKS